MTNSKSDYADLMRLKEIAEIKHKLLRMDAANDMSIFAQLVLQHYDIQWFHRVVCKYLDMLERGEIQKLMIFIPPQHGKSELSSRLFPAYALGRNPDSKIAVCSYAADLAMGFNRSVQKIMLSPEYRAIFPKTRINAQRVVTDTENGALRNAHEFEVIGRRGGLKVVGVGGGLTGNAVDIAVIDDPFKDRAEANSKVIREKVWAWYQDVMETRLGNSGRQLMLFTRWHEDDIAGRIIDPTNPHYDEVEASKWTVIAIPALKEAGKILDCAVELGEDKRDVDDALWPEKHSAEKFIKRRRVNPIGHSSLDQQRPKLAGGNIIKEAWFPIIKKSELPFNPDTIAAKFIIDGAWTEKVENDQTGLLSYYKHDGICYIFNCIGVHKDFNNAMRFIPGWVLENNWGKSSLIHIEKKASGEASLLMLRKPMYGGFNTLAIDNSMVAEGKLNRVETASPFVASGKVVLVQGSWNKEFIDQVCAFPNGKRDDMTDCLTYMTYIELVKPGAAGVTYEQ